MGRVRKLNDRLEKIGKEIDERRAQKEEEERIRQEEERVKMAMRPYPHRWGVKPAPGPCCWKDCHSTSQVLFINGF